jgi:hypothetical protein
MVIEELFRKDAKDAKESLKKFGRLSGEALPFFAIDSIPTGGVAPHA